MEQATLNPRITGTDDGLFRSEYSLPQLDREKWVVVEALELAPRPTLVVCNTKLAVGMGVFTNYWTAWLGTLLRSPDPYPLRLFVPPRQNFLAELRDFPLKIGQPWCSPEREQPLPDLKLYFRPVTVEPPKPFIGS